MLREKIFRRRIFLGIVGCPKEEPGFSPGPPGLVLVAAEDDADAPSQKAEPKY
jgi:hypothetical protein